VRRIQRVAPTFDDALSSTSCSMPCRCRRRPVSGSRSDAGRVRLQELKAQDLKRFYTDLTTLSSTTLAQYHTILPSALKSAMLEGLVTRNVATIVVGKPRINRSHDAVTQNCWEPHEAQALIAAAKREGPQAAAFYALALDSGARKGELCGLHWGDVDLEAGAVTFVRQLIEMIAEPVRKPVFGPIKNDMPRTVDLAGETVALLRAHTSHQAELKMANRPLYQDHGLVFAKEWGELYGRKDLLGLPLQANNLGERQFARLIAAAKCGASPSTGCATRAPHCCSRPGWRLTSSNSGSGTNGSR
jgi:integrase